MKNTSWRQTLLGLLLLSSSPGALAGTMGPAFWQQGVATHFDGLGMPFGGCGVPEQQLESGNYVALNVQNTPGDYTTFLRRPIVTAQTEQIGAFANGLNCGRWVEVVIGDYCQGVNDGAPGQPFCRNASTPWIQDEFNGAALTMLVADSCQDGNAWCRDDANHLDLSTASLTRFVKNGQVMPNLLDGHWANRRISWRFVKAPAYQGDIRLGLPVNAYANWLPVIINHLENGIHGVEADMGGGRWQRADMQSDMGQTYILPAGASIPYRIRVYDADDQLINGGRIYEFDMPPDCANRCRPDYTPLNYRIVPQ